MNKIYFVDFYDFLGLNRTDSTNILRKLVNKILVEKKKQRNFALPGEELDQLQRDIKLCEEALKVLRNDDTRRNYDVELEKAESENRVPREVTAREQSLLEQAKSYYDKHSFEMSAELLGDLLEVSVNNAEAWRLLADCQYMLGYYDAALEIVDKVVAGFPMSIDLRFRQIRYRILFERFDEAQVLLNSAIEDFLNEPLFTSEQAYLYLAAEKYDLARQYIEKYIDLKPSDFSFRQFTSKNIISIAKRNYVFEPVSGISFPINQKNYNLCLDLITWANKIYQDESTLFELGNINDLGIKEFDRSNIRRIFLLIVASMIVFWIYNKEGIVGWIFAALPAIAAYIIFKKSMRPKWMQYRDILRGYSDAELSGDFL